MEEPVDFIDEFPKSFKPVRIPEVHLELRVEGFLVPVFPWASCAAHGLRDAKELAEHPHSGGGVFAPSV